MKAIMQGSEKALAGEKAFGGYYRSRGLGKPVLERELAGDTAAGGYRSRRQ